jgi:hypothetical protein
MPAKKKKNKLIPLVVRRDAYRDKLMKLIGLLNNNFYLKLIKHSNKMPSHAINDMGATYHMSGNVFDNSELYLNYLISIDRAVLGNIEISKCGRSAIIVGRFGSFSMKRDIILSYGDANLDNLCKKIFEFFDECRDQMISEVMQS